MGATFVNLTMIMKILYMYMFNMLIKHKVTEDIY